MMINGNYCFKLRYVYLYSIFQLTYCFRSPPLTFLGICAGKFSNDCTAMNKPISTFFKANMKNETVVDPRNFNYGPSNNKDPSSSNGSQISAIKSTKCEAGDESKKSFLKKYFDLKHSISKTNILEPSHAHSVEGTAAQSSNNIVSTIINTRLEPVENNDAKSFFKRYYDMKNNGPKNDKLKQNCAQSKEEVAAQSSMNSEVQQSESTVPKSCTDINSISLDNTSGSMVFESWINPQEIFPDLDQLDSDVVGLLPSPMQRTLKSCIENRQASTEKCNFVCIDGINLGKKIESIKTDESTKEDPGSGAFISHKVEPSHAAKKSKLYNEDIEYGTSDCKKNSVSNNDHFYVNVNVEHNEQISFNKLDQNNVKNIEDIVIDKIGNCEATKEIHKDVQPSLQYESESQLQLCPQCNNTILLVNYLDHLDFHVAEDLHKQLNCISSQPKASNDKHRNFPSNAKVNDKKKHGIQSFKKAKSKKKDMKLRSITNFFTPV